MNFRWTTTAATNSHEPTNLATLSSRRGSITMATFNPELDRLLLAAAASGMARREFARQHGISELATIARYRRLTDLVWRAEQAGPRPKDRAKAEAKAWAKRAALEAMKRWLDRGQPRDLAMLEAHRQGAPSKAIGEVFGISGERVRQCLQRARAGRLPGKTGRPRRRLAAVDLARLDDSSGAADA